MMLSLIVTHSALTSFCAELRFSLNKRVADIKVQLSQKCATDAATMQLQLKDAEGNIVYPILEDEQQLGYYSPQEKWYLHVVDPNPSSLEWLEDPSSVERYTMPDEEYDKLENSFRAFKRRMQGSKNEQKTEKPKEKEEIEIKCDINVGDRCQVDPGEKRGTVRFVGSVPQLKSGIWIGIEYDEPIGKNDGSLEDRRFFSCPPPHGAFVRPTKVRVGDYPPFDDEL